MISTSTPSDGGGCGRLLRHRHHRAPRHQRHVGSGPDDPPFPDRHEVLPLRHLPLHRPVERLRLEEDHRVFPADRGGEKTLGVRRRRRHHHDQARRVDEVRLRALRMVVASPDPPARRGANDHRRRELPRGAVPHLGHLRDDLVEGRVDEIRELDLGDRAQAVHRHSDRHPENPDLVQRRVDHPLRSEPAEQSFRRPEDPAVAADVLPEDADRRVPRHLRRERVVDRLDQRHLGHRLTPSRRAGSRAARRDATAFPRTHPRTCWTAARGARLPPPRPPCARSPSLPPPPRPGPRAGPAL